MKRHSQQGQVGGQPGIALALSMWQAEGEGGHSLGPPQQELSWEEELNR